MLVLACGGPHIIRTVFARPRPDGPAAGGCAAQAVAAAPDQKSAAAAAFRLRRRATKKRGKQFDHVTLDTPFKKNLSCSKIVNRCTFADAILILKPLLLVYITAIDFDLDDLYF